MSVKAILYVFFCLVFISFECYARLEGECSMICNDLRGEVLTNEMCREAKRTLPRPKVGDFCSTAMEQGFSDACVSLCMEQRPVARVAQTCRAAAVEMPRPTVRRWCEHGYNTAFSKTQEDLASHFKPDRSLETEPVVSEPLVSEEPILTPEVVSETVNSENSNVVEAAEIVSAPVTVAVIAKIPVTIGGNSLDLLLHEGESAEDAVVSFCKEYVKDDVSACIRQMLPEVLERMEAESGGGLRGSA